MQVARLRGVHDDEEHIVLVGPDGGEFLLRIDDELHAAIRRDRAHLGQLRNSADAVLRPKDIQARARRGETAEQIAQDADVSIEYVQRYVGPVLAEREHIAGLAQKHEVRLAKGSAPTPLAQVVADKLKHRDVWAAPSWDAWRHPDGYWNVQATFEAGGSQHTAHWHFWPRQNSLEATDDESRWLLAPHNTDRDLIPTRRGSTDAASTQVNAAVHPIDETSALLDELSARRGQRDPMPTLDELLAAGDPPPAHPAQSHPNDHADARVLSLPPSNEATSQLPDGSPGQQQEQLDLTSLDESDSSALVDTEDLSSTDGAPADELIPAVGDEQPARRSKSGSGKGSGRKSRAKVPPMDVFFGSRTRD